MACITIRNLDDELKSRLRLRAARHGRSVEEEAGPVNLVIPPRDLVREPPDFGN